MVRKIARGLIAFCGAKYDLDHEKVVSIIGIRGRRRRRWWRREVDVGECGEREGEILI